MHQKQTKKARLLNVEEQRRGKKNFRLKLGYNWNKEIHDFFLPKRQLLYQGIDAGLSSFPFFLS